jgi:hypothetical protein
MYKIFYAIDISTTSSTLLMHYCNSTYIWSNKPNTEFLTHTPLFPDLKVVTTSYTVLAYVVLPKISENFNISRKLLALRTCAARCLFLYLSTNNLATGVFISAPVSEFWLFSLHHFHECLQISKWRALRSKELALNFAASSTKLQLRPTEC